MSGSYTVNMNGYYARSGSPMTVYTVKKTNPAYRASYKYIYCKDGKITISESQPSTYDDCQRVLVADANDGTNYVVTIKDYEYYETKDADPITLNLTGSKTFNDQVFEASDTDDTITFNATNVVFSKTT